MNTALQTARALRRGRYTKRITVLSEAELEYLMTSEELTDGEKLTWIYMAQLTKYDETLTITCTHKKISEKLNKSTDTVSRRIKNLRDKGFLAVEYDSEVQRNVYTVILPEEGMTYVDNQPDRRSKRIAQCGTVDKSASIEITPRIFAGGGGAKTPPTPYIKNTSKKNNVPEAQNEAAVSPLFQSCHNPKYNDGYALLSAQNDYIQDLRAKEPSISIMEISRKMAGRFTDEEMMLIFEAQNNQRDLQAQQEVERAQVAHRRSNQAHVALDVLASKERLEDCMESIRYDFEGQTYTMEKFVKDKFLGTLPWLEKTQQIKGKASNKSLNQIMSEVLYYICCSSKKICSQLHKLNTAIKLLKNGSWQTPYAFTNQDIKAREQKWELQKKAEMGSSRASLQALGFSY